MEEVKYSIPRWYNETLVAVGPRNGVVSVFRNKIVKKYVEWDSKLEEIRLNKYDISENEKRRPDRTAVSRIAVSSVLVNRRCREAVIADK